MKKYITALISFIIIAVLFCGCSPIPNVDVVYSYTTPSTSEYESFITPDTEEESIPAIPKETPILDPDVTETPDSVENTEITAKDLTLEELDNICNVNADVQTDVHKCFVDITTSENPYDVIYNYGDEYNNLIAECDWSLIFDVNYYASEFPCLAMLYHNDADLLLQHFQTVGIHEGRQGSASFNVYAFYGNSDIDEIDIDINTSTAYIYYMLHAEEYRNVNTTTSDEYEIKSIYGCVLTALQKQELDNVNTYRDEVGSGALKALVELNALANYRAYTNATENWTGHNWMFVQENNDFIMNIVSNEFDASCYGENTVDGLVYFLGSDNYKYASKYRVSEPHYKAMVNQKYRYFGTSNVYYSNITTCDHGISEDYDVTDPDIYPYLRSQFDIFIY